MIFSLSFGEESLKVNIVRVKPAAVTHYLLDVIIIVVKNPASERQLRTLNHSGSGRGADLQQNLAANQHAEQGLKARQQL
ncbi:hypothetical protein D8M09_07700 [Enterobacter sp. R1(2018)]|nr:hypothetical protein D8M09_07700 [Enterobacter sp. R1(2018)]